MPHHVVKWTSPNFQINMTRVKDVQRFRVDTNVTVISIPYLFSKKAGLLTSKKIPKYLDLCYCSRATSSQSLRFILSLRMNSSFITLRPCVLSTVHEIILEGIRPV